MRIALVGRTEVLLAAGELLLDRGYRLAAVITRPAESYYRATAEDFARLAEKAGAPFVAEGRLNGGEHARLLAESDVVLSVNWPARIRAEVLGIPRHGFLNVHFSDLPRFRGNAGPSWAILAGDDHQGITVHRMVEELDMGPVLLRDRMALTDDMDVGDLFDWWRRRSPEMLAEAVALLEGGKAQFVEQPLAPEAGLRSYPRRGSDALIDWTRPAGQVHRLIRASSRPFPGAFSTLEGERRLVIWRAVQFDHPGPFLAVPGQVLFGEEGDPVIACGEGCLRLTNVAIEGVEDPKRLILASLRNRLI